MTPSPRLLLLVVPFALVPLAGCFGAPGGAGGDDVAPVSPATPGPTSGRGGDADRGAFYTTPNLAGLPVNFSRHETIVASVNSFGVSQAGLCRGATSACYRTPFVVPETVAVDARLVWLEEANDLDMHLYRDGTPFASSAASGPGVSERIEAVLPAGQYDLVVVAWIIAADSFSLDTRFTPPPLPEEATPEPVQECTPQPLIRVGPVSVGRGTCTPT